MYTQNPEIGQTARRGALERDLPPEADRDLPEPPPLRKLVGPGVIAVGIGMAAGEFILWPYITLVAGLGLLWLALVTLLAQRGVVERLG